MESIEIIQNDLRAQAKELETLAQWLLTIASMLGTKPGDISDTAYWQVLVLALEQAAKQIHMTGDEVNSISGKL